MYLPPLTANKRQYSLGIAKQDENYVEGLERWHIGAVQIFVTQALSRRWYYVAFLLQLCWVLAACVPTIFGPQDIWDLFIVRQYQQQNLLHTIFILVALSYLLMPFLVLPLVAFFSPPRFNHLLRYWIIYENCAHRFLRTRVVCSMPCHAARAVIATYKVCGQAVSAVSARCCITML